MQRLRGVVVSWRRLVIAGGMGLSIAGCGGAGEEPFGGEEGPTATAAFELTNVPTAVQCIRVSAGVGTGVVASKTFAVTAGASSANLQFGNIQPGTYLFTGDAFNVSCASIGSVGDWIADPVSLTLRAGVSSSATLTLRKNPAPTITANFVNNVVAASIGSSSAYVATDGGILQAGLINGSKVFTRASFTAFDSSTVPGNAPKLIAATTGGACVARVDGTVWCWGASGNGELGPGIPYGGSSATPVQVTGLTGVTQLASGGFHVCAVGSIGGLQGLYCWGKNESGQLGDQSFGDRSTPYRTMNGDLAGIAVGAYSTYFLDPSRNLVAVGNNTYGQLGDGSTVNKQTWQLIAGELPCKAIVAGSYHACSIRMDNSVRCWGLNGGGQLGIGSTAGSSVPVIVPGLSASQISAGQVHTCAVGTDGQLRCWGQNTYGVIGDGTVVSRTTPTLISLPGTSVGSIGNLGNAPSTCVTSVTSDLYCWGRNYYGELGNGTTVNEYLPMRVPLQ
jgi:hypothetical protein